MSQMGATPCKVLESRIDWLTATVGPGYKQAILAARAAAWGSERERDGHRSREFRWSGYLGDSVDGITYGSREDGSMIRLSGEMADKHALTALTFCSNVSRIDVQVTLQDNDETYNWATMTNVAVQQDARVRNGITRTSLIRSTPKGTTSYIGARASDRYFRVYDKTAESLGAYPPGCWRWEVEYKKDRAWAVSQWIRKMGGNANVIRSVVEQAFQDYGITLPCHTLDGTWRDAGIHHETNDERRLAWLGSCIAPMLEKLSEGIDRATILDTLGLGGLIDTETGEVYSNRVAAAIDDIQHNPESLYNKNTVDLLAALDDSGTEPG